VTGNGNSTVRCVADDPVFQGMRPRNVRIMAAGINAALRRHLSSAADSALSLKMDRS
jgi:hypothetical protein